MKHGSIFTRYHHGIYGEYLGTTKGGSEFWENYLCFLGSQLLKYMITPPFRAFCPFSVLIWTLYIHSRTFTCRPIVQNIYRLQRDLDVAPATVTRLFHTISVAKGSPHHRIFEQAPSLNLPASEKIRDGRIFAKRT
ncbi:hypothetical protein CY34DRAFT_809764 [Suillus luteus UH-Slu-Lm8-n1]|uniref:Uncharacterized protein n=1 Tax=Suillus luteus UH-Slu-Lm8-n1 TaxID=930992 RepID=A0A0D0AIW8_9AGAM|nr:hypothetical protein CY34DRAFT_809764 [Suillus luteus UH-Slu-Lm8-n1]